MFNFFAMMIPSGYDANRFCFDPMLVVFVPLAACCQCLSPPLYNFPASQPPDPLLPPPLRLPVAPAPKNKKSSLTSLTKMKNPLRNPAKKVVKSATRHKE
jgi:hypothetical protein